MRHLPYLLNFGSPGKPCCSTVNVSLLRWNIIAFCFPVHKHIRGWLLHILRLGGCTYVHCMCYSPVDLSGIEDSLQVCFEVYIAEHLPVELGEEHQESNPHLVRVGWSLDSTSFQLGINPFHDNPHMHLTTSTYSKTIAWPLKWHNINYGIFLFLGN